MSNSRIDQIKKLLEENRQDEFLSYALAMEYWNTGDSANAVLQFESLKRDHPEYLALYYQLGKLYIEVNRCDAAIRDLTTGLNVARDQNDQKTFNEIEMLIEDINEI